MIKLYYSRAACSLAVRILLEELEMPYEAQSVDISVPVTGDFLKINPLGAVPAIVMENGQSLTEVAVILQYLCDLKPEKKLAPQAGSLERYRFQEVLNFIATELHKGFGPIWSLEAITKNEAAQKEVKDYFLKDLGRRFDVVEKRFSQQEYMLPSGYTAVDAYAFTILNWAGYLKVDLSKWLGIRAYLDRIKSRPATQKALRDEKLLR